MSYSSILIEKRTDRSNAPLKPIPEPFLCSEGGLSAATFCSEKLHPRLTRCKTVHVDRVKRQHYSLDCRHEGWVGGKRGVLEAIV